MLVRGAGHGWTFASIDYSNIESEPQRISAANPNSRNLPRGDGDHHALTASKVFHSTRPHSPMYKAKSLRALARSLTCLQYGGTEYTIYESMSKVDPTITKERCAQMLPITGRAYRSLLSGAPGNVTRPAPSLSARRLPDE